MNSGCRLPSVGGTRPLTGKYSNPLGVLYRRRESCARWLPGRRILTPERRVNEHRTASGAPQQPAEHRSIVCLILFAVEARPDLPLVIAANRDELYSRPAAPAGPWPEAPQVIGGRDLEAGGSWLGITRSGRWAAVTNYHEAGAAPRPDAPSRGALVSDYLTGEASPAEYISSLKPSAQEFNGFNLLVGEPGEVRWFSNRAEDHALHNSVLAPGVYGLSNHLLNTPWPKVVHGRSDLEQVLEKGASPDAVLETLLDETLADEADLPRTEAPKELERALSARFITAGDYGTRASTVIRIDRSGKALLMERTFHPPASVSTVRHEFHIQ